MRYVRWFHDIRLGDLPLVGGKNASLGELYGELAAAGVRVPDGSNDLTQLVLGVDRDSELVAPLFDERNPAVLAMVGEAIAAARRARRKIGICGQAPSDYPEFCRFLVSQGITSISLNPDALLRGIRSVGEAERQHGVQHAVRTGVW